MKQPLYIPALISFLLSVCVPSLNYAVTDAELEALEKALEQQETEEKRKAEEQAKEAARKRQEAKERAKAEAEAKQKAAEEAARQAELKRQAEREAAKQAEIKRQFEEKAAKQAEQERLEEEKRLLIKKLAGEFIDVPAGKVDVNGRIIEVTPFQMGRHEVTQRQWQQVMDTNPSSKKGCNECPVEFISWHDVQAFIRTLNKKTGMQFRLPTVAEWEYACASGNDPNRCLGHNMHAMVLSRRGETNLTPVTQETANTFGLKGMDSNAWEWTCSVYKEEYDGNEKVCVNKKDLNATRAIRGGAIIDMTTKEVDDVKLWNNSNLRFNNIGFRLVRE